MILAQELVKSYGDITAVNGLSFDIPEGQFFGLLGPNGSGKTTTIHMLSTLIAPTSGSIWVNGLNVAENPVQVRKKIGLVFQESALDRTMSVEENLLFAGGLYGIRKQPCLTRISELLSMFELQDKRHVKVGSLSGGMRRAVDLIRGVLHDPPVLFLDEPTVGLDVQSRKKMWRFVQSLISDRGLTVILTTHYLEEAAPCDQICFIRNGTAIKTGAPSQLVDTLGDSILEIETTRVDECVAALRLEPRQFIVDDNIILVKNDDGKRIGVEEAQDILTDKADTLRIRRPNLNDVFLWTSIGGKDIES